MKKFCYELLWLYRKIKRKLMCKPISLQKYAGRCVKKVEEGNLWLANKVIGGEPFMAARFGSTELKAMIENERRAENLRIKKYAMDNLCVLSGFFPNDVKLLRRFYNLMKESCKEVTLLGVWFNDMEDYMIERYCTSCELTYLMGLEPWYVENPWTATLKGKKVLVIHPFVETIKKQYEKREFLFPGTEILPKFQSLELVKAVQTIAGERDERFSNWFEALEWMYQEAMSKDFEIAIIGCGAYGFPLAAKIKKAGRKAIHMGGATQLLFGIKGARWDTHPVIGKLYNEYWVRPSEEEIPQKSGVVEGGCYW